MAERISGINPEVLIWARQRDGRSVAEVAVAMGQSEATIESWERGESAPTFPQLEKLAYTLYKRPTAIFFFPKPPKEPDPEHAFRTLPDVDAEHLLPDTRQKIRKARVFQLSLAEFAEGDQDGRMILHDVSVSRTENTVEAAKRIREYLGVSLEFQRDKWKNPAAALKGWKAVVEDVGVFVFSEHFKQEEVSGFALFDANFPLIMINSDTSDTRKIFTLFHELSHLLIGVNGITAPPTRNTDTLAPESRDIEVFCNLMAANILLPVEEVQKYINDNPGRPLEETVAILAGRYKVSREMVLRRFLDMGMVDRSYYEAKAAEWSGDYKKPAPPPRDENRGGPGYYQTAASHMSNRYARLAFSRYYQGSISIERLADYLNVKVRNIPGLEQVVIR